LVCLVQVDKVGGGDLRRMADFRALPRPRWWPGQPRSGSTACCGVRRSHHGPPAAAYRVGLAIGVFRRPTLRWLGRWSLCGRRARWYVAGGDELDGLRVLRVPAAG